MSNTLGKEVTRNFFKDGQAGYLKLIDKWAEIAKSEEKKGLQVQDYILYAILRGKDWRKAVSIISDETKVNNGGWFCSGYFLGISNIHWKRYNNIFNEFISDTAIKEITGMLPKFSYGCEAEDKSWDAYTIKEDAMSA